MRVIKRDNNPQDVDFNKITIRLQNLIDEMGSNIDPIIVAQKVCSQIHDNITTKQLDQLASEISISLSTKNPDYGRLAAYIVISDLHKQCRKKSYYDVMMKLYNNNIVTEEYYKIVCKYENEINETMNYQNDYLFDYFANKTLETNYLNAKIETPQDLFIRVAIGIHGDDIENITNTYQMMSDKLFIHATPTLFNSGTYKPQLASCFLTCINDNITSIYKTLSDCAQISKWAGGIGLHVHDIRSAGAPIRGMKGVCTGIVPMLKVFNDTARYVD